MCDCEMPKVFNESKRKAKKQHNCCECDRPILKGENYFMLQGLWDGQWRNYKQCSICHDIGKKYQDETNECYPLGELIQEIHYSDLIENQSDDDDNPLWVSFVDWLQVESHNPLRLRLVNATI